MSNNTKYSDDSASFHFTTNPEDALSRLYHDYCLHIFCLSGTALVRLSNKEYELGPDTVLVLLSNSNFDWLERSDDFAMKGLFISNKYLTSGAPDTNYYTMGTLTIMDNPVLQMTHDEFNLCLSVGESIKQRLMQHTHMFYQGVLRRCVETLMLDIFNIHSHSVSNTRSAGTQAIRLFRQFVAMLERGDYKQQREVRWYAAQIGISPKYLSEICHDSSGHGANYWINRFTTEEVARLLHNPTMTINSIASLMNFTTPSYFSHYVKERLGMTPKDYRLSVLGAKKK